jgi:hypothetical protein
VLAAVRDAMMEEADWMIEAVTRAIVARAARRQRTTTSSKASGPRPSGFGSPAKAASAGGGAEGTAGRQSTVRTLSPETVSQALAHVREAAKRNKRGRFSALMHHLTPDLLAWAFHQLKPKAAPGVDGVRWDEYTASLDGNIGDLHRRVTRGGYRAKPSRRQYIPRSPTAGNGRSASRRWRTRSSNARSWRC